MADLGGRPPAAVTATVDVALVAYRHWELTQSCLEHLRRQTIEHRVVLCDNGCDEGTAERVRAGYPEVTVVRLERNLRNEIACNAAVAAGRGEIVVTMNNDVDARPNFLERLSAPFAGCPELGSVAPLLLRPGEQQIDSAGLAADRTLSAFARLKGQPPSDVQGDEPVLAGPDGAAAAFRRVAWAQVGGLEESLLGYMTDFDLALQLRLAGWETALAPDAIAVHIGSATYGHRSARQRYMAGFGRAYMMRRYGVLRSSAALRALVTEGVVVVGDIVLSRDTAALAGRRAGWRAAAGCARAAVATPAGFRRTDRLPRVATPAAQYLHAAREHLSGAGAFGDALAQRASRGLGLVVETGDGARARVGQCAAVVQHLKLSPRALPGCVDQPPERVQRGARAGEHQRPRAQRAQRVAHAGRLQVHGQREHPQATPAQEQLQRLHVQRIDVRGPGGIEDQHTLRGGRRWSHPLRRGQPAGGVTPGEGVLRRDSLLGRGLLPQRLHRVQ